MFIINYLIIISYHDVIVSPPCNVTGCVGAVGRMNLTWGICVINCWIYRHIIHVFKKNWQ